jgi:enoyl-CoA hydratase
MTYECILSETRGEGERRIGLITLNRPKQLNALNDTLMDELGAALLAFDADDGIGCIVLTGGDKAFAAGADISMMQPYGFVDAYTKGLISRNWETIRQVRKPVIGAVAGFALGGGCELAMASTIRLAVETAKFGQPEVTIGIIPGYGGTQRLPRLVGKGRALQLILSADMIDAQEAYRIGLVNEIVAKDNLILRAEAILNKINANAPTAVKLAIEAANRGLDVSLAEGLDIEASLFTQCFATEDRKEGVAAFREKRKPNFKGQ